MLALKRLFASPTRLVGQPNFEKAPWYYIDLSGIKVAFKNPPQTTAVPQKDWPRTVNLYADSFNVWPEGDGASTSIFRNNWSYFGGYFDAYSHGEVGGVSVQLTIQRRLVCSIDKLSLLNEIEARRWIWLQISGFWGKDNDEKIKRSTTTVDSPVLCHYPKKPEFLSTLELNGVKWIVSELFFGDSSVSSRRNFFLPILDEYVLLVIFTLSNTKQSEVVKKSEKTISNFMENFHVKWSEG